MLKITVGIASVPFLRFNPKIPNLMKKILFSLFAFFFVHNMLQAQFDLSVSAGLNAGKSVYIDRPWKTSPALNYFAEIRPVYHFSPRWSAGLGVQFSQKGHVPAPNGIVPADLRLRFIDLLPALEFRVADYLGIYGGMNVGFKLSEEWKFSDEWEKPVFVELINQVDIGALMGVRLYYKNFCFSAHYNRSLVSVDDITFTDENGNDIEGSKMLLENVQAGVGYVFGNQKDRE